MTILTYLDFDLSIEAMPTADRHRARVLNSPAGQASSEFTLPFSALELENLFLRLGRPRRGVRYVGSPEMQAAQAFGRTLFEQVFSGQVQSCLTRSLDLARRQGQGLRLRLRLNEAPTLADLPWEFLYDPTHSHFLAYSTVTPLVRFLDLAQTVVPLAVQPPLKLLVMIANPRDQGYGALDVEEEWRKVQGALRDLEERGLVQVTRLPATLSALQRQLRREQYHIFHFVGHGGFDQQTQSGVLLLEDEQGRSRLVSGHALGALLRDHFPLRLVLLNACEGARTSRADPFAGVAQHLVQQGIPAVIAMQFEITDGAAITLAHEFYNALADNYGVDAALTEARKALFTAGNDMEWGTPVLYMRAQQGELFDLAAYAPTPQVTGAPPVAKLDPPSSVQQPVSAPEQVPGETTTPQVAPQPPSAPNEQPDTKLASEQVDRATPPASRPVAHQEPAQASTAAGSPPEFDWVTIPAGEFWMGSRKAKAEKQPGFWDRLLGATAPEQTAPADTPVDPNAYDRELPQHRLHLPAYRIARVPVTNGQFRPFVVAQGYTTQSFWSAAGWQWRTQNRITEPRYWQDGQWNSDEQPVVGVSWYEALAYTNWLVQTTKMPIRLPTEAEWEKAARGTDGRLYPWGNQPPTKELCNFNNEVGKTTLVGAYPKGTSPYGVLDMMGNVWEWTVTQWIENYANYATLVDNHPERDTGARRVVRGGSWFYNHFNVRAATRDRYDPDNRYLTLGVRVVLVVAPR